LQFSSLPAPYPALDEKMAKMPIYKAFCGFIKQRFPMFSATIPMVAGLRAAYCEYCNFININLPT
jgi:hypothetical protein